MPLLSDAEKCYVGTTAINTIMAGTQEVWPKTIDYINNNIYMWPPELGYPPNLSSSYGGPILPLPTDWDSGNGICTTCLDRYTVRLGWNVDNSYETVRWEDWIPLSSLCMPGGAPNGLFGPSDVIIIASTSEIRWAVGVMFSDRGPSNSEDSVWYEVRYNGVRITTEWARLSTANRVGLPADAIYNPCPPQE